MTSGARASARFKVRNDRTLDTDLLSERENLGCGDMSSLS
jgi:hypothetical protein